MPSFNPVSLIIDTDQEWWEPNRLVLRAPIKHEPRRSRIIFHETVHYWQQISQGFMVRLAQEDWERLIAYEHKGEKIGPGPIRCEYTREDETYGFSAQDLHESLARFWDVQVIGPHLLMDAEFADGKRSFSDKFQHTFREIKKSGAISRGEGAEYSDVAFDFAMYGVAGNYAAPYKLIRDNFDSVTTTILFPLLGHFSFQTLNPVYYFCRFVDKLAPNLLYPRVNVGIENAWQSLYPVIRNRCIRILLEEGGVSLLVGGECIRSSSLIEHPIYGWVFHWLNEVSRLIMESNSPMYADLSKVYSNAPPMVRAILAIDRTFALLGTSENRCLLLEWLSPPCIRFLGGKTWLLGELHRRELVSEVNEQERNLTAEKQVIARKCVDVQSRWEVFLKSYRGY